MKHAALKEFPRAYVLRRTAETLQSEEKVIRFQGYEPLFLKPKNLITRIPTCAHIWNKPLHGSGVEACRTFTAWCADLRSAPGERSRHRSRRSRAWCPVAPRSRSEQRTAGDTFLRIVRQSALRTSLVNGQIVNVCQRSLQGISLVLYYAHTSKSLHIYKLLPTSYELVKKEYPQYGLHLSLLARSSRLLAPVA